VVVELSLDAEIEVAEKEDRDEGEQSQRGDDQQPAV
jgi:hypothetical protein